MTPEGKVKAEIKAELKKRGWYFFMPVQTGYGATSVDFLVCVPLPDYWPDKTHGCFLAIEAKRADGKRATTKRQDRVLADVQASGGIAVVARSWADVEAALT